MPACDSKMSFWLQAESYAPVSYSYVGAWTPRALRQSKIDIAFMG